MATEALLNDLDALLREEIALHEGLCAELAAELEHDGQLDSHALLEVQRRKYGWVGRIEGLENRRIAKVRELARHWREGEDGLTLRRIIEQAPQPHAEGLAAHRERLLALVNELRRLSRATGANAQARLKAVEATLAVIGEAAKLHPTYSEAGRLQQKPPTFKSTSA